MVLKLNNLYRGDCLEIMQTIPDKSIDMILCDLPYGTTNCKWDCIINLNTMWAEYERIIKDNGAIVLFAQTPFDKVLGSSNLKLLKYEWIWEKTTATGFLNSKKMPLKSHENILVFYKKLPLYNPQKSQGHKPVNSFKKSIDIQNKCKIYNVTKTEIIGTNNTDRFPLSILKFKTDKQKSSLHPTQKPVALLEYLIKTYTLENETILDNCMGSGSTGVACINTNRNFIGIEKEENYFHIAQKRINEAIEQKQSELF